MIIGMRLKIFVRFCMMEYSAGIEKTGIVVTGSWDIDSEMEVCRPEFYWEMPSGTTPVQE